MIYKRDENFIMNMVVTIRNRELPKCPRIFDVIVDAESGRILRYVIQNIRGEQFVDSDDMEKQIEEALKSYRGK